MAEEPNRESGRAIDAVAGRNGVSPACAEAMLRAVVAGGGTMAQFDIAELGGPGRWRCGGMTEVGAPNEPGLVGRVERLAGELAALYFDPPFLLQRGGASGTDTGAPTAAPHPALNDNAPLATITGAPGHRPAEPDVRPEPAARDAVAPTEKPGHEEVLDALERLGALKERGVVSAEEFGEKKRELLARL